MDDVNIRTVQSVINVTCRQMSVNANLGSESVILSGRDSEIEPFHSPQIIMLIYCTEFVIC